MTTLRLGCQTYTWEMLGAAWEGSPDDLLEAIAAAGYSGVEITDNMLGRYATQPAAFSAALAQQGLELAAIAVGSATGFTERARIDADLKDLRRWIDFAAGFSGALVSLGSATVVSPGARGDKFAVAAELYNQAGALGLERGVSVAVHPSSHHNTLLFDRSDYDRIFELLDPELVGWVPDTGHILRGHPDLLDTLRTHKNRICALHLKDVDSHGRWAMLGQGVCDVAGVMAVLSDAPRFGGWMIVEEESDEAAIDPAKAVKQNLETLQGFEF